LIPSGDITNFTHIAFIGAFNGACIASGKLTVGKDLKMIVVETKTSGAGNCNNQDHRDCCDANIQNCSEKMIV